MFLRLSIERIEISYIDEIISRVGWSRQIEFHSRYGHAVFHKNRHQISGYRLFDYVNPPLKELGWIAHSWTIPLRDYAAPLRDYAA